MSRLCNVARFGQRLDFMILELFSNLNGSVIPWNLVKSPQLDVQRVFKSQLVILCIFNWNLPLESPLRLPGTRSVSVELLEVWDRESRAAKDWSMLRRLLEVGNCRYFSGTYPTCPALFRACEPTTGAILCLWTLLWKEPQHSLPSQLLSSKSSWKEAQKMIPLPSLPYLHLQWPPRPRVPLWSVHLAEKPEM